MRTLRHRGLRPRARRSADPVPRAGSTPWRDRLIEIETIDAVEFDRIFPSPVGSGKKTNIPMPLSPTSTAPLTAYTPYNQSESSAGRVATRYQKAPAALAGAFLLYNAAVR
ncbi:MAG: hypothetical protein V9F04_16930 [Dermatophilaceae bacterium]